MASRPTISTSGGALEPVISQAISRNLTDKLYERRKLGALEIEQLVKEFKRNDDKAKILELVRFAPTRALPIAAPS